MMRRLRENSEIERAIQILKNAGYLVYKQGDPELASFEEVFKTISRGYSGSADRSEATLDDHTIVAWEKGPRRYGPVFYVFIHSGEESNVLKIYNEYKSKKVALAIYKDLKRGESVEDVAAKYSMH